MSMLPRIGLLGRLLAMGLLVAAVALVTSLLAGDTRLTRDTELTRSSEPTHATQRASDGGASPNPGAVGARIPPPTRPPDRIGLIAGHWQYDSGAVCADGRREVDVTVDVALRTQAILEVRGLTVDVLPEHDPDVPAPPIQGYAAAALVSIHADSCDVPGASGFKVARWPYSTTPEADDRLVECLQKEYAAATLLERHDESITREMVNYYAFREVAAQTPAAIIEVGFMGDDGEFLAARRYEMAMGIANGISCFLRADGG